MSDAIRLTLLVIRCTNIEESKSFYESLDITFIEEQHGKGARHYAANIKGVVFELYPLQKGEQLDNTRLGFLSHSVTNKSILIDPDGRKVEITPLIKKDTDS